jgi:hypothetical protein
MCFERGAKQDSGMRSFAINEAVASEPLDFHRVSHFDSRASLSRSDVS